MDKKKIIDWIDRRPKILFDNQSKLALFWSAKSACTTLAKWIYLHNGMLEGALEYNAWIHEYRDDVYEKSDYYKHGLN